MGVWGRQVALSSGPLGRQCAPTSWQKWLLGSGSCKRGCCPHCLQKPPHRGCVYYRQGHIAPMGVVGGVLAHRMVGVSGWKDVQLPTVLSAALAHSQGNNIDDGECNQNTDQHQQGNAPARNPRLERGRGREGHISHTNTEMFRLYLAPSLLSSNCVFTLLASVAPFRKARVDSTTTDPGLNLML